MSYQLPPETKTSKLESLPEDARKLAEELIADKFGLAEVVSDRGKAKVPTFFGPRPSDSPYQSNTLRGELVNHSGQRFNFMMQLSPLTEWGTQDELSRSSSNLSQLLSIIEQAVKRHVSEFERRYGGFVDQIHLEMNGYRQMIRGYRDLEMFVDKARWHESLRMNHQDNYYETNGSENFTFT